MHFYFIINGAASEIGLIKTTVNLPNVFLFSANKVHSNRYVYQHLKRKLAPKYRQSSYSECNISATS